MEQDLRYTEFECPECGCIGTLMVDLVEKDGKPEPFAVELSVSDGQRRGAVLVAFEQIEDLDPVFVIESAYQEIERMLQMERERCDRPVRA